MIVVRDVFKAKYGKGNELVALFKAAQESWAEEFDQRVLTDASGPFFTVVTEREVESFAEWEQSMETIFSHPGFGEWFVQMELLIESGSREFYRIE